MPLSLSAAENLVITDYVGKWVPHYKSNSKVSEIIYINSDMSSKLEQAFKNGNKQILESKANELEIIGDILVFKYYYKNKLVNKTVLSGWKTRNIYQIYGIMYLYNEGKQFNGLPISFRKAKANKALK